MKKLLIATAALAMVAGTAQAQSSVSVYGILSTGYETMKLSDGQGNDIKQTTTGRQGAQSGSRLGFRGTEDLGGGSTAGFTFELGADMTTGLGAVRVGFLDLANKDLGTLRAGRVDSLTRQVVNTYTSHGNSGFEAGNTAASFGRVASMGVTALTAQNNAIQTVSTVAATVAPQTLNTAGIAANAADVNLLTWGQSTGRTSNTIGYISPSMSGFQVQAQIGKVDSDTSGIDAKTVAQDTQAFGVSYNAGALSVMASTSTEKSKSKEISGFTNAGDVKNKTDIFGASYDLKAAKVFAMYTDREIKRENARLAGGGTLNTGAFGAGQQTVTAGSTTNLLSGAVGQPANFKLDQKDTTLGVTVPVGPKVVLVGSYSMGEIKFDGADKSDLDGYQLQFNYNFSKRTKAYVMYGESKLKDDEGTQKLKGTVAGVQHSF